MEKPERFEEEINSKLSIICKLLSIRLRPRIEELKKELLKTEAQERAYYALDGRKSMEEIASSAGYSNTRRLESLLPGWEKRGLILSIGKGPNKRYFNVENLEV